MNKKYIIMLIMLASILMLFVQNNKHQNRPDAKQIMKNLTSRLKLSSEQQESISALVDKQFKLMESQEGQRKSQSKTDRNAFKNSKDEINDDISELLTKNQQKEYESVLEEIHKNRRNGSGKRN
jgi:hypothetical protein